jgi:hypothetical protein
MIQQHILELAKQGDVEAIAVLLNEELKPQGITATVGRKQNCLYISLEAEQVPHKDTLVSFIREQVNSWHLETLSKIKLYGRTNGQTLPVWQEEIELELQSIAALHQTDALTPTQTVIPSQGEISGQVCVGNHVIQMGSYGGVVYPHDREGLRPVQPRSTPVFLLPPPFKELVGRQQEISSAIAALKSRKSLEFYGASGVGKSVLVRYLATQTEIISSFGDGVISFDAGYQPVADLLQFLFDAFSETENAYKPTEKEIRQALQHKQALLVLDDKKLTQDDLEELISAVPRCTLLLASRERHFWGELQAYRLSGLSVIDAQVLVEKELQRSLSSEECQAVAELCTLLEGNPWQLLLAVAPVRQENKTLMQVANLQSSDLSQSLIQQTLASLAEPQQAILEVLVALGGARLTKEQIEALSHINNSSAILQKLSQQHLVQVQEGRYSLNYALRETVQHKWDLTATRQRAFDYFTTWAQQHQHIPSWVLSETDAIVYLLEWGVQTQRWAEILRLTQAVENSLLFTKQWGLWQQVLLLSYQAAQELPDKAALAMAWHQLGTRALCRSDMFAASDLLSQALHLRESLGDEIGSKITRHNLNFVSLPPASLTSQLPVDISFPLGDEPRNRRVPTWLGGLIVLLCSGLVGFVGWSMLPRTATQPASESAKPSLKPKVAPTSGEPTPGLDNPTEPSGFSRIPDLDTPSIPPPPSPEPPLGTSGLSLPTPATPGVPGIGDWSPKPTPTPKTRSSWPQPANTPGTLPSYTIPPPLNSSPKTAPEPQAPPVQPYTGRVILPSVPPVVEPTTQPTALPTTPPVVEPTTSPTALPTTPPVVEPTTLPTAQPTTPPAVEPTTSPTAEATTEPTTSPAAFPPTFTPLEKSTTPSSSHQTPQ